MKKVKNVITPNTTTLDSLPYGTAFELKDGIGESFMKVKSLYNINAVNLEDGHTWLFPDGKEVIEMTATVAYQAASIQNYFDLEGFTRGFLYKKA